MNIKRMLGDRSRVYVARLVLISLILGGSLLSLLMVQKALAQTCTNPGPAESGYEWTYAGNSSNKVGSYHEVYCQWTGGTCNAANVGQSGTFEEISGSSKDKVYSATYYTCSSVSAPTINIEVYAGACTTRTIHTAWNSISGASSYRLMRGTTVVYSGSNLSYSDNNNGSGLSSGVSYTYTVEARASNGSVLATASDSATAPSDMCEWATITNISPSDTSVATGGSLPITADFSWEGADYHLSFSIVVTRPDNTTQTLTSISGPNSTYRAMPPENPGYSYSGSYTFATPGTYTIRYHGLAKNSTDSVGAEPDYTRTITVCNGGCNPSEFDFDLSNGGGVTVARGGSVGQTIIASLNVAPTQTVSFTNVSAIPSGVSIVMPASCSPDCSRNMTITASSNASLGTYPMTISGTGGGIERTTTFNLTISDTPPPQTVGVSLTATPTTISPGGISILSWSSTNATSCSAPWTSSTATSGTQEAGPAETSVYTITCSGLNGSASDSATVTVTAPASFNYSLSNSGTTNVAKTTGNAYGQTTISKTLLSGTTQPVDLTLSGVPNNVSYSIANDMCSPTCSATINFTVGTGAPVGDHTITVTGSPLNKQTSFVLDITAAPMSVTCVPDPAVTLVGRPVTWTANVTGGTSPYTYLWTGSGIPTDPAPTTNPFTVTYTTLGQKTAQVAVSDNGTEEASCNASSVQVNFNPQFEEF